MGVAIVLVLLVGCASTPGPTSDEATANLILYPSLVELKKHREEQDWRAALETARRMVQNPALREAPVARRNALKIALGALEDFVDYYGATPALDAEAMSWYEEALRLHGPTGEDRAQIEHLMALYHASAGRTGRALAHLEREVGYWQRSGDVPQLVLAYASLASAYADMGQDALRDVYRRKALDVAREYYILGLRPEDPQSWLAYSDVLWMRVDDISGPGSVPEILKIWEILSPIYDNYLAFRHKGYQKLAVHLALSGAHAQAADYFARAVEEWTRIAPDHPDLAEGMETDLLCASAQLAVLRSDYAEGAGRIEQCIARWRDAGMAMDLAGPRLAGRAYEGLGDLARAADAYRTSIEVAEEARASFDVADRIAFFRNGAERSYWGLIRSLAGLAERQGSEQAFFGALAATEQLRGRQLGEIVAGAEQGAPTAAALRRFRTGLPADVAILDYTATDRGLVILALTRNEWRARVLAPDPGLDRLLLGVSRDLAAASADQSALARRLALAGERLVGPAAGLLRDKAHLVVLPDGRMNLVPFDLLGDPNAQGQPLVERHAVGLAPSLRLMLRPPRIASARASLFAVGDPAYPESITVAGLSDSEMRSVERSGVVVSFPPLPETRTEVEAISALFPPGETRVIFGREASESTIKGADLEAYRYVHFATHGIVGGEVPGLMEPALVFAEEPADDGFLTSSEAEQLRLQADLTVLSACNTGSGEYVTGEGVMGMSLAFLVAGSRSVLMSLWSVDSKATELLIVAFYRLLMRGMEPVAALRQAKLQLIEEYEQGRGAARGLQTVRDPVAPSKHLHPYYWAAFVLMGG